VLEPVEDLLETKLHASENFPLSAGYGIADHSAADEGNQSDPCGEDQWQIRDDQAEAEQRAAHGADRSNGAAAS
jgi:hypothetical protein